ncbi:hypothetical protein Lpar_0804 [Legionella parisiensis]|uniref:Uncharacterized protein n=1 Tax=Legionella parisiensis TaxID=45071 RepID=A0A1E5JLW8_9GAMM|nr:hypothetical protein Lpar_0804 [Legionella parisiensis]OEH45547.1 hypothetical protein lpari_03457 [Legionella parisiensis]STX78099.1 Uncharacterised protein [Legionella parisiensis]
MVAKRGQFLSQSSFHTQQESRATLQTATGIRTHRRKTGLEYKYNISIRRIYGFLYKEYCRNW